LVCPLGNNQQDVELILCHLRNTQGWEKVTRCLAS
jgi:hypothetical protein